MDSTHPPEFERACDTGVGTLSYAEFVALDRVAEPLPAHDRAVREDPWAPSAHAVARAAHALADRGLIADDGSPTAAGLRALEPYRVRNAVILAAGASTRFAPISFQRPKGLLKARGEVLIERQIEQLHAAGIEDVVLVVGYRAADFAYLADRYGVSFIESPDYATRNNHASLYHARAALDRTYVCVSDGYATRNPFTRYRYRAEYPVEVRSSDRPSWLLDADVHGRIASIRIARPNRSYVMVGPAFFDRAFSKQISALLAAEMEQPASADKLWESVLAEHAGELVMSAAVYETGTLTEFNALDDLCAFDPLFIDGVDSEALDNITDTLGCARGDIGGFYPLKEGLTNLSCHFTVCGSSNADGEYVYRAPGVGTEALVDRVSECAAQKLAHDLGLDATFLFEDPHRGWKLSRFLPTCTPLDPADDAQLASAMRFARTLHESGAHLDRSFDFYDESERYRALLAGAHIENIPGFRALHAAAAQVRRHATADDTFTCITHNDFFSSNFLREPDGTLHLIDWEYAGMGDYANDFGTFCVCCRLSEERAGQALAFYFGRTPTAAERRHNFAFIGLAGWCWFLWSLYKREQGANVGEWMHIYASYAQRYLKKTLTWYESNEKEPRL